MKKIFLFLLFALTTSTIYSQDITGQWYGGLKVQGTQLRLIFNIIKAGEVYTATMDSPDQKAMGIPVTTTSFSGSVLKIAIARILLEYEGTLSNNIIVGTFKQGGQVFPMTLTREPVQMAKPLRPQEPAKPYPYYVEDVTFKNETAGITLAGTLTLPNKEGNFPSVILISGSGAQNRDEELMGHKPFLVLADYLTKNGIAVLRFDDRGTAASQGDFQTAVTTDFATDVESALKYLQTRKEINKNKIGLIGHSEGGIIAPIVANNSNAIRFIVLLAGTGIPGDQLLLLQQDLVGRAAGAGEEMLLETKRINKGGFDIIKKSTDIQSLKTNLAAYEMAMLKDNTMLPTPSGVNLEQYISVLVNQYTSPWMVYFIKYDPAPALEKLTIPVLALNGSKDLQVPAKENLEAIQAALTKGGNKNFTVKELPGLNHLFQEAQTGSPTEYGTIEQTFSPLALKEISDWILGLRL